MTSEGGPALAIGVSIAAVGAIPACVGAALVILSRNDKRVVESRSPRPSQPVEISRTQAQAKRAALSDMELARLADHEDRGAAGELVRRSAPVIADLLRRMGAPDAVADDITQDALVAALRSVASYRGEAAFSTWAMKIAARLYLKRRRREARTELMADPVGTDIGGRFAEVGSITRLDLDRALQRLSTPNGSASRSATARG